jgi:guanylate kinase
MSIRTFESLGLTKEQAESTLQRSLALSLAGPSGVGKRLVTEEILRLFPNSFHKCVSTTTRAPRPDEIDGKHYHFVTVKKFQELIAAGEFLEYAEVYGTNKFYGTLKAEICYAQTIGRTAFTEMDVQGARQMKKNFTGRAAYVFLYPPTFEELERRLRGRATESEEVILRRLAESRNEVLEALQLNLLMVLSQTDEVLATARHVLDVAHEEFERPITA